MRGSAISPLDIADLAITMLECPSGAYAPGENQLRLLKKLLNVDRHRASIAEKPAYRNEFTQAARFEAQGLLRRKTYGVRELAKRVSVSPSTIIAWRKSAEYQSRVEAMKRIVSQEDEAPGPSSTRKSV
jgi:hypothetical protein